MITSAQDFLKILEETQSVTHCKACLNFNESKCDHFGQKPPADFYDKHCEFFEEQLPF